jgi:hypothetical protein
VDRLVLSRLAHACATDRPFRRFTIETRAHAAYDPFQHLPEPNRKVINHKSESDSPGRSIQSPTHRNSTKGDAMNRYQPSTPRAAIGLFATAMTAFTIALAVVVPANMDVSAQQERLLARSNGASAHSAQIVRDDAAVRARHLG